MKLEKGKTVHIGGRKFRGEIPDELVPAGLKKPEPKPAAKKGDSDK